MFWFFHSFSYLSVKKSGNKSGPPPGPPGPPGPSGSPIHLLWRCKPNTYATSPEKSKSSKPNKIYEPINEYIISRLKHWPIIDQNKQINNKFTDRTKICSTLFFAFIVECIIKNKTKPKTKYEEFFWPTPIYTKNKKINNNKDLKIRLFNISLNIWENENLFITRVTNSTTH